MGYGTIFNRQFTDETVKNYKSDYVRLEPIRKRCASCGYKIGGDNHNNGEEHNTRKKKK